MPKKTTPAKNLKRESAKLTKREFKNMGDRQLEQIARQKKFADSTLTFKGTPGAARKMATAELNRRKKAKKG